MASLAPTFGRGAMTNHWVDIKNADIVLIMGGNPAEAHPCGFKWVTEALGTVEAAPHITDAMAGQSRGEKAGRSEAKINTPAPCRWDITPVARGHTVYRIQAFFSTCDGKR